MKKLSIITALLALSFPPVAQAEVIKTVENGRNVIYVTDDSPGATVQLQQTGGQSLSARMANGCGVVRLSIPSGGWSGNISVNGTTINPNTLAVPASVPTCANGSLTPAQTTNYKDSSGNVYLVGFTANTAATIGLPSTGSRSARANGCGFARFLESTTNPWTSSSQMSIAGTNYTFSSITSKTYAPYCRNVGTSAAPNYIEYEAKQ